MKILFSDVFAADFATIVGDITIRETLDSGKVANDMYFWKKVRDAFVTDVATLTYNYLHFVGDDNGDEILNSQHHINPGQKIHNCKILRAIWKAINNAEYKAALSRFTVSGTHNSNFFSFCKGILETYYLHLHLQQWPELNGMVKANLPDKCFVVSDMSVTELKAKGMGSRKKRSSSDSKGAPLSSCNSHDISPS